MRLTPVSNTRMLLATLSAVLQVSCTTRSDMAASHSDSPATVTVSNDAADTWLAYLESANRNFVVAYHTAPDPIPLNEPFQMHVRVCDSSRQPISGQSIDLAVDARMPQHRHGMNRAPVITRLGGGEFHVENMLFHMPGSWEIYFDVLRDGVAERAQTSVELE